MTLARSHDSLPAGAGGPQRGSGLYLAGICTVASLGGFLFGFDTAVISGIIGFVQTQYALGSLALGWFASSALIGCIAGAASICLVATLFFWRYVPETKGQSLEQIEQRWKEIS